MHDNSLHPGPGRLRRVGKKAPGAHRRQAVHETAKEQGRASIAVPNGVERTSFVFESWTVGKTSREDVDGDGDV